ncbi:MAG TPA: response regulator [Ectothiorhodospiraceae bacterium]|nr:response regulator [Ectothiorhodospiraceae bacterium]
MAETFDILLIEDDPLENMAISSILEGGFVHLIKYSVNSELATDELSHQRFDVVIVDIDTLNEDRPPHREIIEQLKQQNPHCLIIALTSDVSPEAVKPLLEIDVRKIINKPYSAAEILDPIHQRIGVDFEDFQQQVNYEHRIIDKKVTEIKELIAIKPEEDGAHQTFSQKIKQLSKLISDHFLLEERHMTLYSYPDLDLHQDQHSSLLDDINMLLDVSGNNKDVVDEHLDLVDKIQIKLNHDQNFIEFVSHLSHMNNVYAT